MAFELPILKKGFKSTNDLSAASAQFTFVKMDAANPGQVVQCAATTDIPVGVLQNNPKAGDTADVMIVGITKVVSAAALTVGLLVGCDASGNARSNVAGTDTTKYVVGQVIGASGGANGLASTQLNCCSPHRAA